MMMMISLIEEHVVQWRNPERCDNMHVVDLRGGLVEVRSTGSRVPEYLGRVSGKGLTAVVSTYVEPTKWVTGTRRQ
jgi:hypothetical protein